MDKLELSFSQVMMSVQLKSWMWDGWMVFAQMCNHIFNQGDLQQPCGADTQGEKISLDGSEAFSRQN